MNRIDQEKHVISCMIKLYCSKKYHIQPLCPSCKALQDYAFTKLSHCKYGENKTFCNQCPTHCYSKKYREEIKKVMRFSGPWILLYHPFIALKHLLSL